MDCAVPRAGEFLSDRASTPIAIEPRGPSSDTDPFLHFFGEDPVFQEAYKWLSLVLAGREDFNPGNRGVIANTVCDCFPSPKIWHQSPFSDEDFAVVAFRHSHSSRDTSLGIGLGV
ncbi:hypothetical protein MRB53_033049 [Persea americana]|uniref:Uncharacterized protein n=1 Tax=Persea americana TaxID=3435 RepID=A0ACC2KTG5_PERAE|nr:hypothetical protein MRB53_033049 [Persea americana]